MRRFGNSERLAKTRQCSCGGASKLIKRRNFPFGRNSVSRTINLYRCGECRNETILNKAPKRKR